ncbi:alpha-ketoglutarate-dependent dioxygenase AlkB [Catelliglobosispora koreensis]|uniref:alpha-ketoglutarate-dependent dioxygenase AlkB n=1 Tax=Catelliglobosispora koreensis TaxID=129052 RepID=UPI000372FB8A|nr:alpha-ketoglutarate-dependent dioxygenase AlkB [Catelliglobosispora koreensis]
MLAPEPFQGSLFDLPPAAPVRTELAHGAWVEFCPGWLDKPDGVFLRLRDNVAWRAERRQMYDRLLDVPRLVASYVIEDGLPDPALETAKDRLNAIYNDEPFATAGLCFYRSGQDSVAWHGDTHGRGSKEDTVIAIVSVGAPRAFLMRPRGGGKSLRFEVGHGDLLVMGGSAQRTWEHAVPKTARAAGPRISVQFRRRNVW